MIFRVFISDWTPQFSVVHSAILHGGYNGLTEALWNGVPVIGFPQMMEQVLNVGRLYHNKLGLRLDNETLNSDKVAAAVGSIDCGSFRSNVKKLQKMFKLAGVDRAVELMGRRIRPPDSSIYQVPVELGAVLQCRYMGCCGDFRTSYL